ncbi:MAG: hypothetical protein ACI8Y7_000623 [Candidatus Woesearchaeota archaeon]|jgi:hypothetical protein
MFIRSKTVSQKQYGYLVENAWTDKGTRQQVKRYLGRIYLIGDTPSIHLHEFTLQVLLEQLLTDLAAVKKKTHYEVTQGTVIISIDLENNRVFSKKKDVVLGINEGYLCSHTVETLSTLCKTKKHSPELVAQIADAVVSAGIRLDQDSFVLFYQKNFM